jgi:integrase
LDLRAGLPTRDIRAGELVATSFREAARQRGLVRRGAASVPDAVATSLVEDGKILKAQARLGHRAAATTLRHYAHATPLDDVDVADEFDRRLNEATG